jgi:hypothetical protein
MEHRMISEIARDVRREWKKPYFGAVPYLQAMLTLSTLGEHYGCDDAKSIVLYFLANANTFRGEKARALKAELKAIVGVK